MPAAIASAGGLLALLEEPHDDIKKHALTRLDAIVHDHWFQISSSISSVEALYEDEDFSHRGLAALVASKVFYHLGELDDALNYALYAGNLFDVNDHSSEYVQTLIATCLDKYFEVRVKQVEGKEDAEADSRMVAIVERMLDRCCAQGQFEQAVGVALEGRRLDLLEKVVAAGGSAPRLLQYALRVTQRLVTNRAFRNQVLRLLVRLYATAASADHVVEVCQCLMFLDDAADVARCLDGLLRQDLELLAYQVAFELQENEMQSFLTQVQVHLETLAPKAPAAEAAAAPTADGAAPMETDAAPAAQPAPVPPEVAAYRTKLGKLKSILNGKVPVALYLDFLYRHNKADLQILKNIKGSIDARNSVTHSATILANALMHVGTTCDTFLRDNLDWLSRATNWAKFSATASLGVIHRGHLEQGRALMAPYLPRNGASGSPYSEGGALYALGLIYANHGSDIKSFLLESLRGTSNEVTQHGSCLGLGLAALGTADEEVFEDMKNILYADSAVAGEAAGIGIGLLLAGTGSAKAAELLAYAHETQHEKIIRGVAMGLAVSMYGCEESAEPLIEQMTRDQDPILRYGGMYVIGLAYRGTDNNSAVQKLLNFAVTDVSDDVRRAAVLNLGFVLMNVPEQCPRIVALLAESFNPHVRYGAAMAVGMACAGTGLKDAQALLEPMLSDPVDYVRQGAVIAMALVMLQQPEARLDKLRKRLEKSIGNKHEEVMAKMGSIMASGILDAGGRNVGAGLRSRSGYFRRTAVIGLAIFTQYWYWYPLTYFLSLVFQPTALLAVNTDLALPQWELTVGCKPSTFAYLPPLTAEKKEEVSKVPTAVLSTTAKAKERAKRKEAAKKTPGSSTADSTAAAPAADGAAAADADGAAKMDVDGAAPAAGEAGAAVASKKDEPTSYTVQNPCRVVPAQAKLLSIPQGSRYQPVKPGSNLTGIVVVHDLQPDQPVELVANSAQGVAAAAAAAAAAAPAAQAAPAAGGPAAPAATAAPASTEDGDEPPPPAPFQYQAPQ